MLNHSLKAKTRLRSARAFCQNLAEFDHALWISAQQQLIRDDLDGVFQFYTSSMRRIEMASDGDLHALSSGVCASFKLTNVSPKEITRTLSRPYSVYGAITTLSDGMSANRRSVPISGVIRDNLISRLFDVASAIAQTQSPQAASIKLGLALEVCEVLETSTIAQIRRAAMTLAEEAVFETRFPERIIEPLCRSELGAIAQKKLNFALCGEYLTY